MVGERRGIAAHFRALHQTLSEQRCADALSQRAGDELQCLGVVDRRLEGLAFLDPDGRPKAPQPAPVIANRQVINLEGLLAELAAKGGARDRLQTADRLDPQKLEVFAQVVIDWKDIDRIAREK